MLCSQILGSRRAACTPRLPPLPARVEDVRGAEGLQRCGAVAESMPLIPPLFGGNSANEVCKKVDKGRGYGAGHVQRRHVQHNDYAVPAGLAPHHQREITRVKTGMFEVATCRRAILLVLGIPVYVYVEAETPRGLARPYARIRGLEATARLQSPRLPFHNLMRNARCYAPLALALKSLLESDDELGKIGGRRYQTTRSRRIEHTWTVRKRMPVRQIRHCHSRDKIFGNRLNERTITHAEIGRAHV